MEPDRPVTRLDMVHLVARAREEAFAGGLPLRNRWGFAASDRDVGEVLRLLMVYPDDTEAALQIGLANCIGDIQLCHGHDNPLDEDEERKLVDLLRPLVRTT